MSTRLLPRRSTVVEQASTVSSFVPLTDWVPCPSAKTVKALLEVIEIQGANAVEITAAREFSSYDGLNPGASGPLNSGSPTSLTTEGKACTGIVTVSSTTTNRLVRFGVLVDGTSGTSWSRAEVALTVAIQD